MCNSILSVFLKVWIKKLGSFNLIVAVKTRHREVILSKCPECDNKVVVWNIEDTYLSPREYTEMTFKQIKDKASELVELL